MNIVTSLALQKRILNIFFVICSGPPADALQDQNHRYPLIFQNLSLLSFILLCLRFDFQNNSAFRYSAGVFPYSSLNTRQR